MLVRRPFDTLTSVERRAIQDKHLADLLQRSRSFPPYRDLYYGIDLGESVQSITDLHRLPILTKKRYREYMEEVVRSKPEALRGGYLTRSSGTTGEMSLSFMDANDWTTLAEKTAEVLLAAGLKPTDRVANLIGTGGLSGTYANFNAGLEFMKATILPFGSVRNLSIFVKIARQFSMTAVVGIPPAILPLLRNTKRCLPDFTIDKFIFTGLPLNPEDRVWLHEELGATVVASVITASEIGLIGYQDATCSGLEHCLIDDYTHVEIVDKKGQPARPGAYGNIVVTNLRKIATPVIRLQIGDQARFVSRKKSESESPRKLDYLGRSDDLITIGDVEIRYRDVAYFLVDWGGLTTQLVASGSGNEHQIEILVESEDQSESNAEKMLEALRDGVPSIKQIDQDGEVKIILKVLKPGELKRNPTSDKIPFILDHRVSS